MDHFDQEITTLIYLLTGSFGLGYLCGSISSAILICRLLGLPDPRTKGSFNSGATNVLRIGGKKAATVTLLGDILKGIIPLLIIERVVFQLEISALPKDIATVCVGVCGFAAILGHMWPIFFRFKGGKGVATALGVLHTLSLPLGLIFDVAWVLVAATTRYSSLAAVIAWVITPVIAFWLAPHLAPFLSAIGLLVIFKHKENFIRLAKGEEGKLGQKN